MGNRAVIAFEGSTADSSPALYLHWNGGRASVIGFLNACRDLGYHNILPVQERRDAVARLIQAWFKKGSVYVGPFGSLDQNNMDNGVYVVGPKFDIVGRKFAPREEEVDADKTAKIYEELIALEREQGAKLADVELRS